MKICGIEIKGTEAVICLLSYQDGLFALPDCRVRKIEFSKRNRASDLKYFQSSVAKLVEDYSIEKLAIKERAMKGKFAGGALGFKMEAAIQLIDEIDVELMSATEIKSIVKKNPVPVDFSETGLKIFQEQAFVTAYALHMRLQFPSSEE